MTTKRFESMEAAVESFLDERRSGSTISVRDFSARHAYLGDDLVEALESLELLESARTQQVEGALRPNQDLGPYRIVREIGRGGMGVVFEAVETTLGRRVALKCLPPEFVSKPSARARFEREAAIPAKLDHSGICTVYGAGVSDGQPWIAMRFVEGSTLAERIALARTRGERWLLLPGAVDSPRGRVLAIARCIARVARALAEAHAGGFVHRDVKPSNVMVTPHGEPVLLDFGLASAMDSDLALTRTGDLPGTPAYLAPEWIAGGFSAPDTRCDVYSLGVTLFECLALEVPFAGPTREALYHSILTATPRRIVDDDSALTHDLKVVVATALERDRARRYASAAEFAADLERVVAGHPITARPISNVGRVARWAKREPRQATLAFGLGLVALALAVVGGAYWASRFEVREAEAMLRAKDVEHRLVDGFRALASDEHDLAESHFEAVLSSDSTNQEALAGRILVSIDRHDRPTARARLESAPRTPVFDDLRALEEGRPPRNDATGWREHADAFQLFVSGTRLRRAVQSAPITERQALARRAFDDLTEAILRSPVTRVLYHDERALAALDVGDARASKSAAAALQSLWPNEPNEMYAAAIALSAWDVPRSRQWLERATELKPDFELAWSNLAMLRYRSKDYQGSLAAARQALKLKPDVASAYNQMGLVYDELKCLDDARAAYARVIELQPNAFEPWANWAQIEFNAGEPARAADMFLRAIELDPCQAKAHWWRAVALGRIEQWEAARVHFEVAVALEPKNPAMWQGWLSATTALKDLETSLYVVERALELQPGAKFLEDAKKNISRALHK